MVQISTSRKSTKPSRRTSTLFIIVLCVLEDELPISSTIGRISIRDTKSYQSFLSNGSSDLMSKVQTWDKTACAKTHAVFLLCSRLLVVEFFPPFFSVFPPSSGSLTGHYVELMFNQNNQQQSPKSRRTCFKTLWYFILVRTMTTDCIGQGVLALSVNLCRPFAHWKNHTHRVRLTTSIVHPAWRRTNPSIEKKNRIIDATFSNIYDLFAINVQRIITRVFFPPNTWPI